MAPRRAAQGRRRRSTDSHFSFIICHSSFVIGHLDLDLDICHFPAPAPMVLQVLDFRNEFLGDDRPPKRVSLSRPSVLEDVEFRHHIVEFREEFVELVECIDRLIVETVPAPVIALACCPISPASLTIDIVATHSA